MQLKSLNLKKTIHPGFVSFKIILFSICLHTPWVYTSLYGSAFIKSDNDENSPQASTSTVEAFSNPDPSALNQNFEFADNGTNELLFNNDIEASNQNVGTADDDTNELLKNSAMEVSKNISGSTKDDNNELLFNNEMEASNQKFGTANDDTNELLQNSVMEVLNQFLGSADIGNNDLFSAAINFAQIFALDMLENGNEDDIMQYMSLAMNFIPKENIESIFRLCRSNEEIEMSLGEYPIQDSRSALVGLNDKINIHSANPFANYCVDGGSDDIIGNWLSDDRFNLYEQQKVVKNDPEEEENSNDTEYSENTNDTEYSENTNDAECSKNTSDTEHSNEIRKNAPKEEKTQKGIFSSFLEKIGFFKNNFEERGLEENLEGLVDEKSLRNSEEKLGENQLENYKETLVENEFEENSDDSKSYEEILNDSLFDITSRVYNYLKYLFSGSSENYGQ